jgi:DNA-directed RNA polymerase subunit RPC12/RpoP
MHKCILKKYFDPAKGGVFYLHWTMNFVQLRSYDNYLNANMQLSMLKEQGINCYIKDEYTITIDPLLSPAIGGMKLMVDELQIDGAEQILKSADQEFLQTIACPNCGHHSLAQVVQIKTPTGFLQKIKSILVNGQEQEIKKYYQCTVCGFTMDELPSDQ